MREYWDEWEALPEEEKQRLRELQESLPPYHGKPMGQLLDERREAQSQDYEGLVIRHHNGVWSLADRICLCRVGRRWAFAVYFFGWRYFSLGTNEPKGTRIQARNRDEPV